MSAAALHVMQRPKWWHDMASDGRRGPERGFRNGPMAPRHQSLNGKWWRGSRASRGAPGRVRRGATAVATAMKVDAMVGSLRLS